MPNSDRRPAGAHLLPALALALAPVLAASLALPVRAASPEALAPAAPDQPAPPSRPGLDALRARLPEQVEAFRRTDVFLHPTSPGEPEGLLARYRSRRVEASLFLYGIPGADVPDGIGAPGLRGELGLESDGLRDQLRRTGTAPRDGEATVVLRGAPLLLCHTFERLEAALLRSDWLCLGGVAGRSFKLHALARHTPAASAEVARAVSRLAVGLVVAADEAGG